MHIIDRGPRYPSNYRYALGRVFEVDGERVVDIEVSCPRWYHIQMCETESDEEIIEMEEDR